MHYGKNKYKELKKIYKLPFMETVFNQAIDFIFSFYGKLLDSIIISTVCKTIFSRFKVALFLLLIKISLFLLNRLRFPTFFTI